MQEVNPEEKVAMGKFDLNNPADSTFLCKSVFSFHASQFAFGLHAISYDREVADLFLQKGNMSILSA